MHMQQHITSRNQALDFAKGFLVIAMVVYHTMNYFLWDKIEFLPYINYIAGSFIFISGLICGTIYFQKYHINSRYVFKRLSTRSFKLAALFFLLNLIIHAALSKNYNGQDLGIAVIFNNLYSIFIIGNPSIMAFEILLPIAYLLLVCQLLFLAPRLKYVLFFLLLLAFGYASYENVYIWINMNMILTGIGGFLTGLIYSDLSSIFKNKLIHLIFIFLLLVYLFVLAPLGIRLNYFTHYILINIVVANLYIIGSWMRSDNPITKFVVVLGQYSLVLYLAQILILQILHKVIRVNTLWFNMEHVLIIAFVSFGLLFICQGIIFLRGKSTVIDNTYRLIFS